MADKKITVLYVDDEENNLFSFKATFRLKYQVITAISGQEALKILEEKPVEIIVTDLEAKSKLSQNRSELEKNNIISSLSHSKNDNEQEIAQYMLDLKQNNPT